MPPLFVQHRITNCALGARMLWHQEIYSKQNRILASMSSQGTERQTIKRQADRQREGETEKEYTNWTVCNDIPNSIANAGEA